MKMWILIPLLGIFAQLPAHAEDLESLLEQKHSGAAAGKNTNYLADTLRGILRAPSPEQNYFLRLVEEGRWSDALLQFKPAFQNSSFGSSEDGRALKSLLMFRSGLVINALENLLQIRDPKKIHFQILTQWRESAPASHPAWQVAKLPWKKEWTELFGLPTEIRVRSAELSLEGSTKSLKELAALAPEDSRERALLDWNMAIQYGIQNDTKKAAVLVSNLMKAKNNPVPQDLVTITAARLLYQSGYFEAAQKYYDKVPKASEYYLEAQEEKAWAYLKIRQPQDALAITQTLTHPTFSGQVSPETWFVRALAQLKVCDYPQTLETLREFPKEFKSRSVALEALSKDARQPAVMTALQRLKKGPLGFVEMTHISKNLPRGLVHDERLRQMMKSQDLLDQEVAVAEKIFASSLKGDGLQGDFETIKNNTAQRAHHAEAQALNRVQELAKSEVAETKAILNKLHIVEAEVIQQVESAQRLAKNLKGPEETKKGTTGGHSEDVLKFPFQNEFWFDELTNYKVDIKKGCQARGTN